MKDSNDKKTAPRQDERDSLGLFLTHGQQHVGALNLNEPLHSIYTGGEPQPEDQEGCKTPLLGKNLIEREGQTKGFQAVEKKSQQIEVTNIEEEEEDSILADSDI